MSLQEKMAIPKLSRPIITVDKLSKTFNDGKIKAVDNVSFEVKEGEIFGFLGPNGAGKTTTINMLTTLLKPSSGDAEVCGYDIRKHSNEVRRAVGVVPQESFLQEKRNQAAQPLGAPRRHAVDRRLDQRAMPWKTSIAGAGVRFGSNSQ